MVRRAYDPAEPWLGAEARWYYLTATKPATDAAHEFIGDEPLAMTIEALTLYQKLWADYLPTKLKHGCAHLDEQPWQPTVVIPALYLAWCLPCFEYWRWQWKCERLGQYPSESCDACYAFVGPGKLVWGVYRWFFQIAPFKLCSTCNRVLSGDDA